MLLLLVLVLHFLLFFSSLIHSFFSCLRYLLRSVFLIRSLLIIFCCYVCSSFYLNTLFFVHLSSSSYSSFCYIIFSFSLSTSYSSSSSYCIHHLLLSPHPPQSLLLVLLLSLSYSSKSNLPIPYAKRFPNTNGTSNKRSLSGPVGTRTTSSGIMSSNYPSRSATTKTWVTFLTVVKYWSLKEQISKFRVSSCVNSTRSAAPKIPPEPFFPIHLGLVMKRPFCLLQREDGKYDTAVGESKENGHGGGSPC